MQKDCDVKITATRNPAGQIEFDMEYKNKNTELLLFDKSKDGMKKADDYLIVFTLVNGNGVNLAFVNDPGGVMYVSKGSDSHLPKCPKNGSGNGQTPFQVVTPVQDTVLKVRNPDSDINFYKFALRFEDRNNGNNIVTFDPIYDNRNGGSTKISANAIVAGVGGVAVGALVTMAAYNVGLFG